MSHRRAATSADRFVDRMLGKFSWLRDVPDGTWDNDGKNWPDGLREMLDDEIVRSGYGSVLDFDVTDAGSTAMYYMDDVAPKEGCVAMWSRWRSCRHVYRFDGDLGRALTKSKLPRSMPMDAFRRLPYPIIYIESDALCSEEDRDKIDGIFAWIEGDRLLMMTANPKHTNTLASELVNVTLDTFGDAIDEIIAHELLLIDYDESFATSSVGREHEVVSRILAHLLYIMSDDMESVVEYRPSGRGRKRRKNASQSTIHAVGTKVGRALRQSKVRYVGERSSGGQRRSVATHVRAGHFHHYWTGPRSKPEERRLVVHWIPPIVVNAGGHTDGSTTVHSAR